MQEELAQLRAECGAARFDGDLDAMTFGAQGVRRAADLARLSCSLGAFEGDEAAG
jgi:hypothetical protein